MDIVRQDARRARLVRTRALAAALTGVLLALAGCAFSPELAGVREVRRLTERWEHPQVDPRSVHALQARPWGECAIVLVAAQAVNRAGSYPWRNINQPG